MADDPQLADKIIRQCAAALTSDKNDESKTLSVLNDYVIACKANGHSREEGLDYLCVDSGCICEQANMTEEQIVDAERTYNELWHKL